MNLQSFVLISLSTSGVESDVEVMVGVVVPQLTSDVPVLQLDGSGLASDPDEEMPQLRGQVAQGQDGQGVAIVEAAELLHEGNHYEHVRERTLHLRTERAGTVRPGSALLLWQKYQRKPLNSFFK